MLDVPYKSQREKRERVNVFPIGRLALAAEIPWQVSLRLVRMVLLPNKSPALIYLIGVLLKISECV